MIVIVVFGAFEGGSVARRALLEAKILADAGEKVTLITSKTNNRRLAEEFKTKNRIDLIELKDYFLRGPLFNVSKDIFFNLQLIRALFRLQRKSAIKLVITNSSTTCYPIKYFCQKKNIPSVFIIHALIWDRITSRCNPYNWPLTALYKHANSYALKHFTRSIANSDYVKNLAIKHGAAPEKMTTIYNPVEQQLFFANPQQQNKSVDLLFVGRFAKEKGIGLLAEIIMQLPENIYFQAIGSGKLLQPFKEQVKKARCQVELLGQIDNDRLPGKIRQAKLFLAPSLVEAQGLAVAEALACGTPAIASNRGGLGEMIKDGVNGWLVKPLTAELFSKKIVDLLTNQEELERAANNASKLEKKLTMPYFSQKIIASYRRLYHK